MRFGGVGVAVGAVGAAGALTAAAVTASAVAATVADAIGDAVCVELNGREIGNEQRVPLPPPAAAAGVCHRARRSRWDSFGAPRGQNSK